MDWQAVNPTDDAIEAVIQQATSSAAPYSGGPGGLRDTRTQLFVGNLPYRVRWQDLKDLFRKAGTVLRADVSLGPDNRSRGYGTVLLATAEDAGRAVDTFNGYSWQSRILQVRLDRQLQEIDSPSCSSSYFSLLSCPSESSSITDDPVSDTNSRSLFVGNLPFHCQWQDLKDLFRQAGTIIRADVVLGPDGKSRGFGSVVFATELDAERALRMFNGYEFNGRVLNVHRDKYTLSNYPDPSFTLPPGYMLDFLPSSRPPSPHEMVKLHAQQQLHPPLQQYLNRPQYPQQQKHHQSSRLYGIPDLDNRSDTQPSPSILNPSTQSSSSSSTSIPPSSHTNTASSGSDRSEMFSRLSSTSVTSAASSKSSLPLSRPHSQGTGYPYGQVPAGQQARGQSVQTLSYGSQHCSSSHSSPPRTTSACCALCHPPSSDANHHRHSQHPGPISLPPPLLPSQIAFNVPLQQFSPHVHTPLGMSVSVSVSPLVEYPGGPGMYGQHQQHHMVPLQATTPHGLPMTPSMPSFTFLPSAMPPGSHEDTSAKIGGGDGSSSSGGHRHARTRSKSFARRLEMEGGGGDEDEHVLVNSRTSSASPPPSSSSVRQRHPHYQQCHHHSQQPTQPSRRSASSTLNVQPTLKASTLPQSQLQALPMHINLNGVPGAFSPGVVMSPGTFYGRPGEVPTFINAAVGAPLTMRGGGGGEVMSEGGPTGVQGQGQVLLGQRYHQNQTHGAYFYAMSRPKATGMEPKGYFDPLFFPGVNVGGNVGGGGGGKGGEGGDSWNVGSDALVNEIMKDGHGQTLGVVEVEKDEEGRRKGIGRGGEEETHISDDGDDEKDSGDDDDDDDSEPAEEGKNKETYDTDTCPPTPEDHKDGDRRPNKGVGAGVGTNRVSQGHHRYL